MGTIDTMRSAAPPRPLPWRIVDLLLRPLARLDVAAARYRSRRALLELDEHLLKDIGISRADAEREARRSFWD